MFTSITTAFVPMADDNDDDEIGWNDARWIVSGGRAGRVRRGSAATA